MSILEPLRRRSYRALASSGASLRHAGEELLDRRAGLLGAHPGWSVHEADADGHAARLIARLDFAADPQLTAVFAVASGGREIRVTFGVS